MDAPLKQGKHYWIQFPYESKPTIGWLTYEHSGWPWLVMGSDEIYDGTEFEVICEVQEPPPPPVTKE